MSNNFKEDMSKIKLDEDLKNGTINLMKSKMQEKPTRKRRLIKSGIVLFPIATLLILTLFFVIPSTKSPYVESVQAQDLMKGIKGDAIKLPTNFSKNFLDSTSDFSISMFKELSKEHNAVYSPISIYLALGTVLNGADGNTKQELLRVLAKYNINPEELNLYNKSLISELTAHKNNLKIENSIWYDNSFDVNKDFLKLNKTYYDSSAYKLNLKEKNAPDAINTWVKGATNNKIDKMVEKIDPNTVMMILSTIYFQDEWKSPFSKKDIYKSTFNVNNNLSVKTDFMSKESQFKNTMNSYEQIVSIPYKDENLSFVAMMPKDDNADIRGYISKLNKDSFSQKINSLKSSEIVVNLPKFEISFGKSIKQELSSLGMNDLFNEDKANLRKMGIGKGNTYSNDILQKTYFKMNEDGTEAASSTNVEIQQKCLVNVIRLNRPFVYAIVDNRTNLPIFMGVMDNPKP